jgi:hypothetical protein
LEKKHKYDVLFDQLGPINGKISGRQARIQMEKSKLPKSVLSRIWELSDVDRDGMLDADEFALAQHFINIKLNGNDIPKTLPCYLIPPSKRAFQN